MKRWSEEELNILREELASGTSQPEIAKLLNRTYSSVMHKVQRLGIQTKTSISWSHLNKEDIIDLVKTYKVSSEFDSNPDLPGYKWVLTALGYSKWSIMLDALNLGKNPKGRYFYDKAAIFYVLECYDVDGTMFYKYGVTQTNLERRYGSYLRQYKIILIKEVGLQEALEFEDMYKKNNIKYIPKSNNFYSKCHGGYSECFILNNSESRLENEEEE